MHLIILEDNELFCISCSPWLVAINDVVMRTRTIGYVVCRCPVAFNQALTYWQGSVEAH